DSDFFLALVPGVRDRSGLPESIRFWKDRIDPVQELTFTVGLIYGPSGCGKSSLVRAGLAPHLATHVRVVYVEATPDDTEARLLRGLRKYCRSGPAEAGLEETLTALRTGPDLPAGQKVLIILDQFEQWLHARDVEETTPLVQALRQCDGLRVQALLLVRDDFWLAVSRFLHALEARLVEGENAALVDLFDPDHARKVLTLFGRAYDRLPEAAADLTADQKRFLDQAVVGLTREGRIICVRLALFAEMVKAEPWAPATLAKVGGTAGIGVAFLERTFSAADAPAGHRLHQKAARAVLQALLPTPGTNLRGHMRSRRELLEASGYANEPRAFEDLLHILDSESRLVTPTDPEGIQAEPGRAAAEPGRQYYQLTHDYLVPALREWLTRKQRETWHGRAEMRLLEWTALYEAKPTSRNLPSWWEWGNILLFTRPGRWSPGERKMMGRATRWYTLRGGALLLVLLAVLLGWWYVTAGELVDRLMDAEMTQVPAIVADLRPYRLAARHRLEAVLRRPTASPQEQVKARLALLPGHPDQVDPLCERLLTAGPDELRVLREALIPYRKRVTAKLWAVLEDPQAEAGRRFRAACALADYDPGNQERWAPRRADVAGWLVRESPLDLNKWAEDLRPLRELLEEPLAAIMHDGGRPESERTLATTVLGNYAADQPGLLAELVLEGDARQFVALAPALDRYPEEARDRMGQELDRTLPPGAAEDSRDALARRQANAAVFLLRLGRGERVWPLLRQQGPDPRRRTFLVHRLGPMGAEAVALVNRLGQEPDGSARRALLLSLGEVKAGSLPVETTQAVAARLLQDYRHDPDPGIHSAIDWLLRQRWGRGAELQKIDQELASTPPGERRWYVSRQGHTLTVVPGPVTFSMGSPADEPFRYDNETLHFRRIPRSFAIATRAVTCRQFQAFTRTHGFEPSYVPDPDCPMTYVTWFEAAAYCNWLSAQEGIAPDQWCYQPNAQGQYAEGMKLAPHWLERQGYRLPTEAEWECACRAGAATSRTYGTAVDLLGQYAWYGKNSDDRTWPVGQLKPNDLGLFDVHGNVAEWCQDRWLAYPAGSDAHPAEDREDPVDVVSDREARVLRGGTFVSGARFVRTAYRMTQRPSNNIYYVGFRVGRTWR
ncbi:MAG: SUMF1/EgtB/PvdO family nonheme iron enzyme, partial [Planctomycetes bacterium]|nr:SUMF1/EgtB/PvdO family nonheme iron enzyme [Planctomycetota bacterium]